MADMAKEAEKTGKADGKGIKERVMAKGNPIGRGEKAKRKADLARTAGETTHKTSITSEDGKTRVDTGKDQQEKVTERTTRRVEKRQTRKVRAKEKAWITKNATRATDLGT